MLQKKVMPISDLATASFGKDPTTMEEDYYATAELTQRLNLICHLIQNSEQLVLVLAENGYGKTSLLRQLQKIAKRQHEHWWVYLPASSPALSADSLMATLLTTLNTRHEGKSTQALEETLRNQIAAARYNGQLPILLIDDAHMLPLATLKLIVELAMQGETLTRLRAVLLCEPQITSILVAPEFKIVHNTLIHTLDIPPFNPTQVRDYLQFRLKNTQYHFETLFNHQEIKRIHNLSEGVPGRINVLAQQTLLKQGEPASVNAFRSSRTKLLWSTLILFILMTVAFVVHWNYPELFNTTTLETPPQSQGAIVDHPALPEKTLPTSSVEKPLPVPPVSPPVSEEPSKNQPMGEKMITTPTENKIADSHPDLTAFMGRNDIKDAVWLRSQNPNAYTIQLLGAHDPANLKDFLNQYPLLTDMAIFKTRYREREWYVLLQGIYPDRTTALTAIAKLPEPLRQKTEPWARSLMSVHAYIDESEP